MAHNVKLISPEETQQTWSDLPWGYLIVFEDTTAPTTAGYALMQIYDDDGNCVYTGYFLWTDKDDLDIGLEEPYYYWEGNSEGESPQLHLYQDKFYTVHIILYSKEDEVERELWADAEVFYIEGTHEPYTYAAETFVSITPSIDTVLTDVVDTAVTLVYSGPVMIDPSLSGIPHAGELTPFQSVTSADGSACCTTWTVVVGKDVIKQLVNEESNTVQLYLTIVATDAAGRRCHAVYLCNSATDEEIIFDNGEDTYSMFVYDADLPGGSAGEITTSPADGDTVERIHKITFYGYDIAWSYDVDERDVQLFDSDGNLVAYGVEVDDNYSPPAEGGGGEVICTEVYVTLNTEVTQEGDYTLVVPAGALFLANDGYPIYSGELYIGISIVEKPLSIPFTDGTGNVYVKPSAGVGNGVLRVWADENSGVRREAVMTIQTVDGSISHSRRIIQHGTEDDINLDSIGTEVSIELTVPEGIEWRIVAGTEL